MPWQIPADVQARRRAARGPRLRVAAPARPWRDGTPGIGRWPIAVPAVPGEQATSWLARVGYRYDLSPQQLLAAMGARTVLTGAARAGVHVDRHRATVLERLGLDGLPLGAAGDVLAHALEQGLAGYRQHYRGDAPRTVATKGTRYCPACLADNGGVWPERWRSPLHLVCPEHLVLLEQHCPDCGVAPWSTSAWAGRSRPSWSCTEVAPGEQPRRTRRVWCPGDLRTATARPATAEQMATARLVRDLALAAAEDRDGPVEVAGLVSTHADHLTALLDLLDELAQGKSAVFEVTADPHVVLEGLAVAAQVLAAPDRVRAVAVADSYGVLNPAGGHTPIAGATRGRARHPLLGTLRLLSVAEHLTPTAQLTFRTGRGRPRYPAGDRRPLHPDLALAGQVPLAWIPQQLWRGTLAPHVAPTDYKGRACAAMLLARLGNPRPWQLIAVDLGLPRWFAGYPPAMVARLRRAGAWPDFLGQLEDLADHLADAPPPINYSARRWIATDVDLLTTLVEAAIGEVPYPAPYPGPTMHLVRVFWEVYTGGDLRLAPPPLRVNEEDHPTHRAVRRRIGTDSDHIFAVAAMRLARATLDQRTHHPLWWQPP